jgi:hypothetical protein
MSTDARRLVIGGVVAAGAMLVMAGVVIGAGMAKADPAFDRDSTAPWSGPMGDHSDGAYRLDIAREAHGSVDDAHQLATTICTALHTESEGQLIAAMSDGNQYLVGGVTMVVHGAEWHFCPQWY